MNGAIQTRFNRRARNIDECDPTDAKTVSYFPIKGCPIRAKKTYPSFQLIYYFTYLYFK